MLYQNLILGTICAHRPLTKNPPQRNDVEEPRWCGVRAKTGGVAAENRAVLFCRLPMSLFVAKCLSVRPPCVGWSLIGSKPTTCGDVSELKIASVGIWLQSSIVLWRSSYETMRVAPLSSNETLCAAIGLKFKPTRRTNINNRIPGLLIAEAFCKSKRTINLMMWCNIYQKLLS